MILSVPCQVHNSHILVYWRCNYGTHPYVRGSFIKSCDSHILGHCVQFMSNLKGFEQKPHLKVVLPSLA